MSWEVDAILTAAKYVGLVTLIAAVTSVVVTLIYGVLRKQDAQREAKRYFPVVGRALPFIFLIALVGGLCGQLGGMSREGVVGALLPALFTLFGGYIAYYLGAKKDQSGKIAVNTLAFLLSFFLIYNVSAIWRQGSEALDFCRDVYSDPAFATAEQRTDRNLMWSVYCQSVFSMYSRVDGSTQGDAASS